MKLKKGTCEKRRNAGGWLLFFEPRRHGGAGVAANVGQR